MHLDYIYCMNVCIHCTNTPNLQILFLFCFVCLNEQTNCASPASSLQDVIAAVICLNHKMTSTLKQFHNMEKQVKS